MCMLSLSQHLENSTIIQAQTLFLWLLRTISRDTWKKTYDISSYTKWCYKVLIALILYATAFFSFFPAFTIHSPEDKLENILSLCRQKKKELRVCQILYVVIKVSEFFLFLPKTEFNYFVSVSERKLKTWIPSFSFKLLAIWHGKTYFRKWHS